MDITPDTRRSMALAAFLVTLALIAAGLVAAAAAPAGTIAPGLGWFLAAMAAFLVTCALLISADRIEAGRHR